MSYSINQAYVVFNLDMEPVEWFDTLEDAEEYVEEMEQEETKENS